MRNDDVALFAERGTWSSASRSSASEAPTAQRRSAMREARSDFFENHFNPLLIVDLQGFILDANVAAQADMREGRIATSADGVLRLGSRECARRFARCLADAGEADAAWRRLVVRVSDGEWRLVRIRRMPGDAAIALIEVQPSADDQGADIAPLAQAFALTGSEAVVLASLVEALTPKEIAERLSISSHTVRAHMRAIYAKLGVRARSGVMKAALRLAS